MKYDLSSEEHDVLLGKLNDVQSTVGEAEEALNWWFHDDIELSGEHMENLEDLAVKMVDEAETFLMAVRAIKREADKATVRGLGYDNKEWMLVDKDNDPPVLGQLLFDSDMGEWILIGGRPPHKLGSSGRVYVRSGSFMSEFFPSVFDLVWRHAEG